MAFNARELDGLHDNLTHCPNPQCGKTFTCDACLHLHLKRRYNQSYADVFGRTPEALVDFCQEHAGCSSSVLGF